METKLPTGAEKLIQCLEREGVEYIFGLSGGAAIPIFDALVDSEQPMFQLGTECVGATGYLKSISMSNLAIDADYVAGGITFAVHATGVSALFDTDYALFCLDADTDVIVSADAVDAAAVVLVSLQGPGELHIEMTEFQGELRGLHIDIGFMDDDLVPSRDDVVEPEPAQVDAVVNGDDPFLSKPSPNQFML